MRGNDPENIVRFTFGPGVLDIPPGQVASTTVTLAASRPPAGQQVTRPFVILASDGQSEVQAEGSLIQSSAERRPLARLLLTVLGGLAMIIGVFLPVARSYWPERCGPQRRQPHAGVQFQS